jgi:hypothetical protein
MCIYMANEETNVEGEAEEETSLPDGRRANP